MKFIESSKLFSSIGSIARRKKKEKQQEDYVLVTTVVEQIQRREISLEELNSLRLMLQEKSSSFMEKFIHSKGIEYLFQSLCPAKYRLTKQTQIHLFSS